MGHVKPALINGEPLNRIVRHGNPQEAVSNRGNGHLQRLSEWAVFITNTDATVCSAGKPADVGRNDRRHAITATAWLTGKPTDGVTMAFYDWAQAAVPISISGLEEKKNRGEAKLIDLLETKTKQAEMGIQQFFAQRLLYGAGGSAIQTPYVSAMNGSTFVDPLPKHVAFDPTASLSVGNLNQLTYTWWRNQTSDLTTVSTFAGFLKKLRTLRNNCGKGPGGTPNLHLTSQGTEELYEAALAASHRNPSYARADIPFDNVAFFGKPVIWDEFMPDFGNGTVTQTKGTWLMLNTKFWGIKVDRDTNFTPTPFRTPENQDARTAHILWLGSVGTSNRRKNGVMGKIDETIAA